MGTDMKKDRILNVLVPVLLLMVRKRNRNMNYRSDFISVNMVRYIKVQTRYNEKILESAMNDEIIIQSLCNICYYENNLKYK